MVAAVVIDRLVHHGTVFEFACESQRLKARQRRSTNTTRGRNRALHTMRGWPGGDSRFPAGPARPKNRRRGQLVDPERGSIYWAPFPTSMRLLRKRARS
jgi:hypothetical protein